MHGGHFSLWKQTSIIVFPFFGKAVHKNFEAIGKKITTLLMILSRTKGIVPNIHCVIPNTFSISVDAEEIPTWVAGKWNDCLR